MLGYILYMLLYRQLYYNIHVIIVNIITIITCAGMLMDIFNLIGY